MRGEFPVFDYKAHGIMPEQARHLEACAERIPAIDPQSTFGLLDLGEVLWTARQQVGDDIVDTWAVERCHLTADQRDSAQHAYFALGPHRRRLEQMGASNDVMLTLLQGMDEDVDHGVDTLETYGPIPVEDLAVLMDAVERPIDVSTCHPLLKFDGAAMEELICLKTRNGMAIFQNTLTRLIELTLCLEAAGPTNDEAQKIRLDLKMGAEEAIALFANLALLPHRRTNAPELIQASWPPVASAWTQFDEAMGKLQFLEDRDVKDLAAVRDVMRQLI